MADFRSNWIPTQEMIQTDLQTMFQNAIRHTLARMLEAEVTALVGAPAGARTSQRNDVRNGSYPRRFATSVGELSVDVPRTRRHGAATQTLGRYRRRSIEIDDAIIAAYVGGISTRNMTRVTEALAGQELDKSTVSRITRELEAEVDALKKAPITEEIIYLYLDATFIKARWARTVESTQLSSHTALVAMAKSTSLGSASTCSNHKTAGLICLNN